jgi:hypothetical protein
LRSARTLALIRRPGELVSRSDFKKVDEAADAIVIDPVVVPDFKALMEKRYADGPGSDEALKPYFARNPNSQFKTREDIINSPALEQSFFRSTVERWRADRGRRRHNMASISKRASN